MCFYLLDDYTHTRTHTRAHIGSTHMYIHYEHALWIYVVRITIHKICSISIVQCCEVTGTFSPDYAIATGTMASRFNIYSDLVMSKY